MTRALFFLIGFFYMTSQVNAQDRILNINPLTSPQGIEIWHVEDHNLPIITINFAFRSAGAVNDPDTRVGMAQLLSNTLDEGAGSRDSQTFQEALQDKAIELSFQSGRDHFGGYLKTLVKHKAIAAELLHDALTTPMFEDSAVTRMKNANIMRVRSSLSDPDWLAARLVNATTFGNHPYARNSGGTISGLSAITATDLRDYLKNYLTKDRLVVSIAGDITADDAKILADRIFGTLPAKGLPTNINPTTFPETPVRTAFAIDSPQSAVQMVWESFPKSDPDYYALRVMDHMLGSGGFSAKLMEEVREKRGLTYGIYSRLTHMDYANYISIESSTAVDNVAPMTAAVNDVIEGFKTTPVDAQKLQDAKSYLIGSLPLRFSSTQSLSRTALAMRLDGLPITYLDGWTDQINAITPADIQRVANRIFASTTPRITVIAGGVPADQGFTMIKIMPGVE